jgi:hypothetical protein
MSGKPFDRDTTSSKTVEASKGAMRWLQDAREARKASRFKLCCFTRLIVRAGLAALPLTNSNSGTSPERHARIEPTTFALLLVRPCWYWLSSSPFR